MSCEDELILLLCSIWLELCVSLALWMLHTAHVINGDQWKAIQTDVFDAISVLFHGASLRDEEPLPTLSWLNT